VLLVLPAAAAAAELDGLAGPLLEAAAAAVSDVETSASLARVVIMSRREVLLLERSAIAAVPAAGDNSGQVEASSSNCGEWTAAMHVCSRGVGANHAVMGG
jgi:hypothetical protein